MKQQHEIEKLNDFWFRVLGIPLLNIISVIVLFLTQESTVAGISFLKVVALTLPISVLLWEVNRQLLIYFRRRLPQISQSGKRIAFSFLSYLLFSSAVLILVHLFCNYTLFWGKKITIHQLVINILINTIFTFLIGFVYETIYYLRKLKMTITEQNMLKKGNLQSQLETLKSHVNPHFLFNSLNTLEALVEEKSEMSAEFVRQLSNVYRFILQNGEKQLITVEEELGCIDSYCYLLKTRFGNNISFKIETNQSLSGKQIPGLTIQMLVENAMKHNIVSASKPLQVRIYHRDQDSLTVENNLQKKNQLVPSAGIGLNNIRKRYELLGNKNMLIEETSSQFNVTIPLLPADFQPPHLS